MRLSVRTLYPTKDEDTTNDMSESLASQNIIESGFRTADGEAVHVLRPTLIGGRLKAAEFLSLARISEAFGDGTLRLTSRQGIEVTGIPANSLAEASAALSEAGLGIGAVGRNSLRSITLPSIPHTYPDLEALAEEISGHLESQADLPSKLKIGLGTFDDNNTDILMNDIAILEGDNGYTLLAGGGAGGLPEDATGARLAEPVCKLGRDQLLPTIDAAIAAIGIEAERRDASHRRFRHVLADRGSAWMREQISEALGADVPELSVLPAFGRQEILGWHEQPDGKLWLGFPILTGRVVDIEDRQMMSGLNGLAADFGLYMILTSDQNIVFCDINPESKDAIIQHLRKFGCWTVEQLTPVSAAEITCPGAPVCRLGLAPAEGIRHPVIFELEGVMDEFFVRDRPLKLRLAGCPRGCSRPYTGEVGFVAEAEDSYAIYLGGLEDGTALGERFAEDIKASDLPHILEPVFELYSEECETEEPFGNFIRRWNREEIDEMIADSIESRKVAWAL